MRRIGLAVVLVGSLVLAVAFLVVGAADAQPAREQPRFGGVLKIAISGEPPSLDSHLSTATITSLIMRHVCEPIYTADKDWSPIPHLAAGHTVTDGGRQYTITLRKGVRFHNGKEMTAADVVASLDRWGRIHTLGKTLWKSVEALDAKGPYEVVVHLKEPSGVLLSGLTTAYIYPKEVIDATGDGQLKAFIGTGPFRFVEHKPDRHVRLARFKDYAARSEPPNGLGGKRIAYLDELLFIPVPDIAVRLAGAESGSTTPRTEPCGWTPEPPRTARAGSSRSRRSYERCSMPRSHGSERSSGRPSA